MSSDRLAEIEEQARALTIAVYDVRRGRVPVEQVQELASRQAAITRDVLALVEIARKAQVALDALQEIDAAIETNSERGTPSYLIAAESGLRAALARLGSQPQEPA